MRLRVATAVAVAIVAAFASAAVAKTQYPTVFTKFKLEASSSSAKFKGQIDSPKGKCVKGRQVKLKRKHNGNTTTLGSDKTGDNGKFSIKLSTSKPKNGKYYAKVKNKKFDNDQKVCASTESGSIKVS